MKKILFLTSCLILFFILVNCNIDTKANRSTEAANETQVLKDNSNYTNKIQSPSEQNVVADKKEPDSNDTNSVHPSKINPNEQEVKYKNNISQKITPVTSKVKLYTGTYFDDKRFGENTLKNYCEVVISNVTSTSFDFTIYEVNELDYKKNKNVIFLTNTAIFTGDGMRANFYGNNYTLNFTFPNNHHASPIVTDIEISGFKPLEGNTYVNNGIPGHEFG